MNLASILPRKGEIKLYLSLALPMVISNGAEAVMLFVDRLFMSMYESGSAYLNASLVGGLSAFVTFSFFSVTAGFTNVLVAQYLGAKKKKHCAQVTAQAIRFAMFSYPIILLAIFIIDDIFILFNHSQLQTKLETSYYSLLVTGSLFVILRSAIGGFFIAIGRTQVVMAINTVAMLVNIPLNYLLIFGPGLFPAMGIQGAAFATILASGTACIILLALYFGSKINREFSTRAQLGFKPVLLKKLIRFGAPNGFEVIFGVAVFDFFIMVMNSYGQVIGSAVTIAINWDSIMFIPMMGASFATSSLVGRHMGAGDIQAVKRTAMLSFALMLTYASIVAVIMLTCTAQLVAPFLWKIHNKTEIRPIAMYMVRMASIYLLADAANLSFSGVLWGAGDSRAVMLIFVIEELIFGLVIYLLAFRQIITPTAAWIIFVIFAFTLGLSMILRYAQGKWQRIKMLQ